MIAYSAIAVALAFCNDVKADACSDFAYLVDALNNAKPHQRPALVEVWQKVADDPDKSKIILRAYSYVAAGGSEGGAWKQCKTY